MNTSLIVLFFVVYALFAAITCGICWRINDELEPKLKASCQSMIFWGLLFPIFFAFNGGYVLADRLIKRDKNK